MSPDLLAIIGVIISIILVPISAFASWYVHRIITIKNIVNNTFLSIKKNKNITIDDINNKINKLEEFYDISDTWYVIEQLSSLRSYTLFFNDWFNNMIEEIKNSENNMFNNIPRHGKVTFGDKVAEEYEVTEEDVKNFLYHMKSIKKICLVDNMFERYNKDYDEALKIIERIKSINKKFDVSQLENEISQLNDLSKTVKSFHPFTIGDILKEDWKKCIKNIRVNKGCFYN
jgi:hypothetical protein